MGAKKYHLDYDYVLLIPTLSLLVLGLVATYSASSYLASHEIGDSPHYLKRQAAFCLLGLLGMILAKNLPSTFYRRLVYPILLLSLGLVCLLAWADTPAGAEPARRVVSLNPSLTATLVAVGALDVLVGVDRFSAGQQAEVTGLPQVGGLSDPSLEAVIALRPDLVVLVPSAEQRDFRGRLTDLGVPVLAVDPVSFEEVLEAIVTLGERVGRGAAARARAAHTVGPGRPRDRICAHGHGVRRALALRRQRLPDRSDDACR